MANTTPPPDPSAQSDEELFANLTALDRHNRLSAAARVITELRNRRYSYREIAAETGVPRATVQDWATHSTGEAS